MRIGYIECFAGVSGDMMLGALVDAGVPRELLEKTAAALGVGAELGFARVDRSGISATKVNVLVVDVLAGGKLADSVVGGQEHDHPHVHRHEHSHAQEQERSRDDHSHAHGRGLAEIRALIVRANLDQDATALALRTFELLAEAESKIHNVSLEQIHFHEVGAVDAIVDIVCSAVGLVSLGVDQWTCSALNVGGGFVECAHGKFPVPAPATAELLRGAPTYSFGVEMELVTPTGAAIVRALDCTFDRAPAMRVERIGYGAGSRDPKRFPNVLRLNIGDSADAVALPDSVPAAFSSETIAVLECAVDDSSPQVLAHCAQMALDEGALDVMSAAVVMKKGRMGTLLTVLCRREDAAHFQRLLFRETSTLGIRVREEQRACLDRKIVAVETEYGTVRIKVAMSGGDQFHAQPEYEDCRLLAAKFEAPLKQVIEAAMLAFTATPVPQKVRT